jgi:cytochrome b561
MANPVSPAAYSPAQRRLHWIVAALIVAVYLLIEQRGVFERGSTGRTLMMQSHFWLGLCVFALAAWRLALRRRLSVPPITPAPAAWSATLAKLVHWALYAFFLVMPILGLLTAWTGGRSPMLPGGLMLPSPIAEDPALHEALEAWHETIGKAFYAVIALHVVASLYHHFVRKDDTLRRMWGRAG